MDECVVRPTRLLLLLVVVLIVESAKRSQRMKFRNIRTHIESLWQRYGRKWAEKERARERASERCGWHQIYGIVATQGCQTGRNLVCLADENDDVGIVGRGREIIKQCTHTQTKFRKDRQTLCTILMLLIRILQLPPTRSCLHSWLAATISSV